MAAKTPAEAIAERAVDGISRVKADGTDVEAMPIGEQIQAAEYEAKKSVASKNHLGITFRTLVPGGTGGSTG